MTELLRPYQVDGARWLCERPRAILGDKVGLGKTRTALAATPAVLCGHAARVQVICPAIVREHWRREALVMGVPARVCSYHEAIRRPPAPSDVLILDECHFLRNRGSKRTKLLLGPATASTPVIWGLSGTPMPRSPADLYPILTAFWPEIMKRHGWDRWWEYLNAFCVWHATPFGIKVVGMKNRDKLAGLLAGRMLRRTDVPLPPVTTGVLELTVDDLRGLPDLEPWVREAIENGRLPDMSPNLARYRHEVGRLKAPAVVELLDDELEDGEKRVVLAYHRDVLDALEHGLHKHGVLRVDGSTPDALRQLRVRAFEHGPERVFLGQIGACGTGLDGLQRAAARLDIVEPEWDTSTNAQAIGRLARLGQTRPVLVRFLTLADTLDEPIMRQHERETAMVARVIEGGA